MGFDFSGKIAVVTGGANGIGAAARVLAQAGARVSIFDLRSAIATRRSGTCSAPEICIAAPPGFSSSLRISVSLN